MNPNFVLPKIGELPVLASIDSICKFEKVPTIVSSTAAEGAVKAADIVVNAINRHRSDGNFVLGLSTGRTPLGLYAELVKRYKAGEVSFKNVEVYSLDEFYPMEPSNPQSRNHRVFEDFLNYIDIDPRNVHFPDGTVPAERVREYCKEYEQMVHGNVDLMIMGVGELGQVGFNEPGSYSKSTTRLVQLTYNSRRTQNQFFSNPNDVPKMAITMGLETIKSAKSIVLLMWGEDKSGIARNLIEGEVSESYPATNLQQHPNMQVIIDEAAAQQLTRVKEPWLVAPPAEWTPKLIRKAVIWLCELVNKPILKLTFQDYINNSLSDLLERVGTYDQINIRVFNDVQHIISGWPGGKPNADDSTRPVPSNPYPKRVLLFSPHPDDDVISMGGTFNRLIEQGHDVHVAYETSGNVAVNDDVVLQNIDTAREMGFGHLGDLFDEIRDIIETKIPGLPEPRELLNFKGAIRRAEARAACRSIGLNDRTNAHFLNLPFYETGGIRKGELSDADIEIVKELMQRIKPHQIYAAGDLADPHGTHRVCIEAVLRAFDELKDEEWAKECHIWLYRGAWQEWDLSVADMAVPLSPEEMIRKRHAIFRHLSQKDIVPFPGEDSREFWQRAEDRMQATAHLFDKIGLPEYQAIEMFVKLL
ncbi:MAG: glucosamine-6-phosphate deaminase [Bacteroidaceae bacterium]|nr:glucosamine-6-phosphate deaminase [Bacteroidaceae bacterium]